MTLRNFAFAYGAFKKCEASGELKFGIFHQVLETQLNDKKIMCILREIRAFNWKGLRIKIEPIQLTSWIYIKWEV